MRNDFHGGRRAQEQKVDNPPVMCANALVEITK